MNSNIKIEIKNVADNIKTATIGEVDQSLNATKQVIKTSTEELDNSMKNINAKMSEHVNDFEIKKRRLFQFDGFKNALFWVGQATNIGSLGLLIYFLFVK